MKATVLSLFALALLLFALPGFSNHGQVQCNTYYDSQAATYLGDSFCWLSGAICYECYETTFGGSCSSNWEECTPGFHEDVQTALRSHPAASPSVQVCRRSESASLTADQLL